MKVRVGKRQSKKNDSKLRRALKRSASAAGYKEDSPQYDRYVYGSISNIEKAHNAKKGGK